jgi:LmbE family N-acetylglucosaminyl deacetylase
LVISPHLDDGVLSCGHFLLTEPGAIVATVMAGHPGDGILSDWDRVCGFVEGDDPVGRRRDEDRQALELVGARPRHLDFLDLPYREGVVAGGGGALVAADIARELTDLVQELAPARVLIPLGLLHADHALTHEGGLVLAGAPTCELWAYKDLPYGLASPELVASQLDGLQRRGVTARLVSVAPPARPGMKRDATACYASQVDPVMSDLGRDAWERTFVVGSEQFWQLARS